MPFDWTLIRSRNRRRTIVVQVGHDGTVTVHAPWRVTDTEAHAFVEEKRSWIERTIARQSAAAAPLAERRPGGSTLYLGRRLPVDTHLAFGGPPLRFDGDRLSIDALHADRVHELLDRWYGRRAREIIPERAAYFSRKMELPFQTVRITSARTRWGSCSARDGLSFTWRLVMAPLPTIDYVIVHELAHIREKNHGPRFWRLVESVFPDHREHRRWLRLHAAEILR